MGIAHSTERMRMSRPLLGRVAAFQLGRRLANCSTMYWNCVEVAFLIDSGRPRYLHGNDALVQAREVQAAFNSSIEQWMGSATLLVRFTTRPEAAKIVPGSLCKPVFPLQWA